MASKTSTIFRSGVALLLMIAACASCQAVGAIVAKTVGTPPVPAQFVPANVPTLVFCEHRAQANVDDVAAEDMGRRVAAIWTREKISPVIDSGKLEQLMSDPTTDQSLAGNGSGKFTSMGIDTVGRKLGASQVLYIDMLDDQIEAPPASDLIRGKVSVRVRIVDVKTALTLWPRDAVEGYPMDQESEWTARTEGVTDSTIEEGTRNAVAESIVRLFYKYTPAQ